MGAGAEFRSSCFCCLLAYWDGKEGEKHTASTHLELHVVYIYMYLVPCMPCALARIHFETGRVLEVVLLWYRSCPCGGLTTRTRGGMWYILFFFFFWSDQLLHVRTVG